jgi:PAS domain S-box-containing protein
MSLNALQVLNNVTTPVQVIDRDYRFVFANPAFLEVFGKSWDEMAGKYVFDVFPETPERVSAVTATFERVLAGETTSTKEQSFSLPLPDGTMIEKIWSVDGAPLFDESGRVEFIVSTIHDVTPEVLARRQKDVISLELEHRLRNTLTMVGALAILTGENADTKQAFMEVFTDRLEAMSRSLLMISDNQWQGLSYRQIVEAELSLILPLDSPRLVMRGPDVFFSVRSTKWTALLAHELVKNAVRYGCFSVPDGKLTLLWALEDGMFITEWIEEGCPPGAELTHSGFGSQMLGLMPNTKMYREMRPEGLYLRTVSPATFLQTGPEVSNMELVEGSALAQRADK